MDKFIRSFSYLFYPLFVPAYATLFYFLFAGKYLHNHEIYLIFIQVLIVTILLPLSVFYLLRSLGYVKTKMLTDKKERKLPLSIYCLLLLLLTEYSFSSFSVPELYYYFLGVLISNVAALGLVLIGNKASLHMMAMASLTAFVISLSAYYHVRFIYIIAFFILCAGFTASARLQAKAHTPGELLLGTLLGIVPQVGLWFIWLLPAG
ncbi:hypothetical protein [Flavobacterium psychrotrophum]|uniref:hypothetical protein n=1 Tax=Flavobacterium psychrotrophum TaxID=2294119 RepID=UPI000E31248C|nr:hypothetical protein [Flavobacterium psychrotrophum]